MAAAATRCPRRVTGVALHLAVAVGKVAGHRLHTPGQLARIAAHQLGACRPLVVLRPSRRDRVLHQTDLPLEFRIQHRALIQRTIDPLKEKAAIRGSLLRQVRATVQRRRSRGIEAGVTIDGAVAVLAANFDRGGHLAIKMPVAVVVLGEMTIGALHARVHVRRRHVNGLLEFIGVGIGDTRALLVEQIAAAVPLEHSAKVPAMAVIVRELRVMQLRIQLRYVLQKTNVCPFAARRSAFGISIQNFASFGNRRILLLLRPHRRCVGLVIPHRVSQKAVHEHVRLVHVTHHALTGRHGPRENMLQGVSGLRFVDGWIAGTGSTIVPELRVNARVLRITVI
jgi:hypothetical protein